ncbi:MAG: ABC transporter permease [Brevundimonas sp.]|uniref:ABC transporter permease n=1 Tax=Brevundimonas sp. TaxID=1871086 RepID=UPI002732DC9F|nr:ABC transporter permease [Brevundimonas sp.]MDP3378968.1 ABC transporter permease [Brevundimonas sp.]
MDPAERVARARFFTIGLVRLAGAITLALGVATVLGRLGDTSPLIGYGLLIIGAIAMMVIPQLLVCGLFVPRPMLPGVLEAISDVMPLSYAVDAMTALTASGGTGEVAVDLAVVAGFALAALALGAATLRRRTP